MIVLRGRGEHERQCGMLENGLIFSTTNVLGCTKRRNPEREMANEEMKIGGVGRNKSS